MIKIKTIKIGGEENDQIFNDLVNKYSHLGKDGIKLQMDNIVVFYEDDITVDDKIKKLKGDLNTSLEHQFEYEIQMNLSKAKMDAIDTTNPLYPDLDSSYKMTIAMLKLEIATANMFVDMLKKLGVEIEVTNTEIPESVETNIVSPFVPDKDDGETITG